MGCHVGFQKEAPECVAWSGSSYIEPVLPIEEARNRYMATIFYVFVMSLIVVMAIIFISSKLINKIYPDTVPDWLARDVPFFISIAFFCLGFPVSYIVKWIAGQKIKRRSGLLFEPGKNSYYVHIEDAMTFEKRKLITEDSGFLFVDGDYVKLEMEAYRGHIHKSDVVVSKQYTQKNTFGVRLTVKHDHYPWSIVLTSLGNFRLKDELNTSKKNALLFDKLIEAGLTPALKKTHYQIPVEDVVGTDKADETLEQGNGPVDMTEDTIIVDDVAEKRYREVSAILDQNQKQKKSWVKTVGILVISLLVFLQLGFLSWGLESVLLILLVLIVHEMGHFIGMKMFGYKNVKMFFIPMLGAAVSGHSRNTASWKKALVTLMGPLPGILISLVLFVVFLITGSEICYKVGMMFLFINLLNLLPIFPLDGGRFLHEVLFSRNRYIELVVNIITAIVLFAAAGVTGNWFLWVLGFVNIAGLTSKFKLAGKCRQMKEGLLGDRDNEELIGCDEDEIPEPVMKHMIDWVHSHMPGSMGNKQVAETVQQMWERVRISPPGAGATVGLIAIFMVGYFVSFLSCGVLAVSYFKNSKGKTEIVEFVDPNGVTRYKEQTYILGELSAEIELSDDKQFYHGSARIFDGDLTRAEGQWDMGLQVGIWKFYDYEGKLEKEGHFENGRLVSRKVRQEDGTFVEQKWEDLSEEQKQRYKLKAEFKRGPGRDFKLEKVGNDPNLSSG